MSEVKRVGNKISGSNSKTSAVEEEGRVDRRIKTTEKMKELLTRYYIDAKGAESTDRPICWITSGGPVEFLIAMDVIPVYPENHGAICGAAKMAVELCEVAEGKGFSRDLCSYARLDIGSAETKGGPIGGLPRPDFLLCCNNICGTVLKWYQEMSRYFDVPMFLFDTPFIHKEQSDHARHYILEQVEELIAFLEKNTGRTLSEERFMEVARLSLESVNLWKDVLSYGENRPSPMTCFDAFIHMAPIVTLRGTQEVVDYYKELKSEMAERVEKGISAIPEERIRLLWDNIPIWYEMRNLGKLFASHGACLVADTYTNAWAFTDIDLDDPLRGLSQTYGSVYLNISLELMVEQILELVERFSVDGMVMHSNRSCKPYSLGQYDIARRVTEASGKPCLIIEADMTDSRVYAEGQVRERIIAFLESLERD